jgi:hypothetical protein
VGLKISLDSLKRYFRFFKQAEKVKNQDYWQIYGQMMMEFENLGGIDFLEQCQYHSDHEVYKMAQKLLLKYFEPDSEGEPLIKFLNSIDYS